MEGCFNPERFWEKDGNLTRKHNERGEGKTMKNVYKKKTTNNKGSNDKWRSGSNDKFEEKASCKNATTGGRIHQFEERHIIQECKGCREFTNLKKGLIQKCTNGERNSPI